MNKPMIWIALGTLALILFLAGVTHVAFRSAAQLYLNMYETDQKQNQWIGELYRKLTELERKQTIYEQHMKYEAEAEQKR